MIGSDKAAGTALVAGFRAIANIDALPEPKVNEFEDVANSVNAARFPGAILAWPRPGGTTLYYAVAQSAAEWRRLRPLLLAFAGPTLTDFTGRPESLDPNVPVEDYLLKGGWHLATRLRPGDEPIAQQMVHRSLKRLIQTVDAVADAPQAASIPTSRLLSLFFNSLNGNDRQEALRILGVLRTELRVDALNLVFLEIQIHAHFGDWQSIVELQSFASLTRTRRPPAVSSAMLEALYQVHLAPMDDGASVETVKEQFLESVRAYARPMLRLPPPISLGVGGWRLYALEAICAHARNVELEKTVLSSTKMVGVELCNALKVAGRTGGLEHVPKALAVRDSVIEAKQALTVASEVDSLTSIKSAIEKMQLLTTEQRKALLESEPFCTMWRTLNSETHGISPTDSWLGWLNKSAELEFDNALGIARRGVEEWPVEVLQDSSQVVRLVQALTTFPDKSPQLSRLEDALPLLVAWVSKESDFPRSGMVAVYDALLFHIFASTRRGATVLESATTLIRALLLVGISKKDYKNLLEDALELIGLGLGVRSIDYVLEIIEETVACPSPDPESRSAFWLQVLARMESIAPHLSAMQLISLTRLGQGLGWDSNTLRLLADARRATDTSEDAKFIASLRGKSIGIYSLTEAAARQAESLLKSSVPDIKVTLSNEHVGSPRLKSMAAGTDILVMVTASATHAATTFIQQHRPRELPLLYARGRGCTSILRALEEYAQNRKSEELKALAPS